MGRTDRERGVKSWRGHEQENVRKVNTRMCSEKHRGTKEEKRKEEKRRETERGIDGGRGSV